LKLTIYGFYYNYDREVFHVTELNMDHLDQLKARFVVAQNKEIPYSWEEIVIKLTHLALNRELAFMELSGGEPTIVLLSGKLCMVDFATESPIGRRSLCYDQPALEARTKFPPFGSALGMINRSKLRLINEAEYFALQAIKPFDLKTSSWILTPPEIRSVGGALFAENRYNRTFVYQNSAESYYKSRGFRTIVYLE